MRLPSALLPFPLILLAVPALSADPFDCRPSRPPLSWDLHTFHGPHTAKHVRLTPPSQDTDEVEINLCHDLPTKDDVPADDQCPQGTRICLRTTNTKASHNDRIVRVIPIAAELSSPESSLSPSIAYGSSDNTRPLTITLHGPSYPPGHHHAVPQSANVTVICASEATEPKFISYSESTGVLLLEWDHPAGCAISDGGTEPEDGGEKGGGGGGGGRRRGGSGVGWFFLALFLAIIAYFALGAYYNYSQYGASGWDLLPHRDFWRDVPFLLRDIASHLVTAVRPGGGRGGYTSV